MKILNIIIKYILNFFNIFTVVLSIRPFNFFFDDDNKKKSTFMTDEEIKKLAEKFASNVYISKFLNDEQIKHWNKDKEFLDYFFCNPVKRWHKFHIVSPSPWPFFVSINLLTTILHFVSLLYRDYTAITGLCFGLFFLIGAIIFWFRDIIREATFMGYHSYEVQMIHRTGFVLFLISEVMIFFGVFWAYFHFSLTPSIFGGNIWPPEGIVFFFISENLWDDLRFIYLSGFYEYDLKNKFMFFEGLIFFPEKFSELYLYVYLFFDLIVIYNICFFIEVEFDFFKNAYFPPDKDSNAIVEFEEKNYSKINMNSLGLGDFFYFFPFFDIYYYNLYTIDVNYDNLINYDKSIVYLNLYDSGALVNPYRIPLLNTVVLLTSGCILMWSHTCLRLRSYLRSVIGLGVTILFAFYFIGCQAYEYTHAAFSINDGSYGSVFYLLTGLHGFHVIIGTIFLIVCFYRMLRAHFTSTNHFGFEAAIWYWHFVDVVWLFLYVFVYVWPSVYYFSESTVLDNYLTDKTIFFNINFKEIERFIPIFDYNKNIWHDYNLKIPMIYYSLTKYLNNIFAKIVLTSIESEEDLAKGLVP